MTTAAVDGYLVEQYGPGLRGEEFHSWAIELERAATAHARDGKHVQLLRRSLVPEDEYVLCTFLATSPDLVREAHTCAGVPFGRISPVITHNEVGAAARSHRK